MKNTLTKYKAYILIGVLVVTIIILVGLIIEKQNRKPETFPGVAVTTQGNQIVVSITDKEWLKLSKQEIIAKLGLPNNADIIINYPAAFFEKPLTVTPTPSLSDEVLRKLGD